MRSNKDRKLNLGTAFRLTIMNQFVKKNLDVKIHKLCNLANTEEIQCLGLSHFLIEYAIPFDTRVNFRFEHYWKLAYRMKGSIELSGALWCFVMDQF